MDNRRKGPACSVADTRGDQPAAGVGAAGMASLLLIGQLRRVCRGIVGNAGAGRTAPVPVGLRWGVARGSGERAQGAAVDTCRQSRCRRPHYRHHRHSHHRCCCAKQVGRPRHPVLPAFLAGRLALLPRGLDARRKQPRSCRLPRAGTEIGAWAATGMRTGTGKGMEIGSGDGVRSAGRAGTR